MYRSFLAPTVRQCRTPQGEWGREESLNCCELGFVPIPRQTTEPSRDEGVGVVTDIGTVASTANTDGEGDAFGCSVWSWGEGGRGLGKEGHFRPRLIAVSFLCSCLHSILDVSVERGWLDVASARVV